MSSHLRISLAAIGFVPMFSANVSVVRAERKLRPLSRLKS
jgi:hypothetical protein